jgi:hypothetical protein
MVHLICFGQLLMPVVCIIRMFVLRVAYTCQPKKIMGPALEISKLRKYIWYTNIPHTMSNIPICLEHALIVMPSSLTLFLVLVHTS